MVRMLTQSGDWIVNSNTDKALLSDIPVFENYVGSLPKTASTASAPFKKFQRFGYISQAATPTPTNPSPLVCNCGEINEAMFESYVEGENLRDEDRIYTPASYTAETLTVSNPNSQGTSQTCSITPLFKSAGGTADVLDVLTGKITRNVGIIVLTGMETSWSTTSGGLPAFELAGIKNSELLWCTHFTSVVNPATTTNMPDGSVKTDNSNNGKMYFKYGIYTNNLNGWITWLQEQYDAGTPVIVAYRLVSAEDTYQDPCSLSTYSTQTQISSSYANATVDIAYRIE